MQKYEVIVDTKIVEDNTADSLQVKVYEETVGETVFESKSGDKVEGSNLTVKKFVGYKNLGDLKARLEVVNSLLATLPAEKVQLEADIIALTVTVDKAVEDILKDPTAEDKRGVPAPIEEPVEIGLPVNK